VVIVKPGDEEKVVSFLRKFGAEVYSWTIELRPEDKVALMGPS
jgi:hypothetical protein